MMVASRCVLCFSVVLCLGFVQSATTPGCILKNVLSNPKEQYLPVMLHNRSCEYSIIIPTHGQINLKSGEGITFVCPDRNYLVPTQSNFTYATCVEGTILRSFNINYNFEDILCSKPIRGAVQKTNERCGGGIGKIMYIGHRVTERYFQRLITVCYDENEGNNLYSQHLIYGREVAYTSKFKGRPAFSTEGAPKDVAAAVAYKRAYQKSALSSLLGSSREAERYINNKSSFLSRGHLSPDADFLFAGLQLTTYFYINTCPQWQSINGGNWARLEDLVRRVTDKYQHNFIIISGTHKILELPNINSKPTKIYLVSKTKLPVPKFVWKVVFDAESGRGIAFVSLNNPFVDEITQDDLLCTNICDRYGWGTKSFSDFSRGYIYCCDINELRQVVSTIPSLKVNGILSAVP